MELEADKTIDDSNCSDTEKESRSPNKHSQKKKNMVIVDTADTNKLAKLLRLLGVPDANQSLPVLEQAKNVLIV